MNIYAKAERNPFSCISLKEMRNRERHKKLRRTSYIRVTVSYVQRKEYSFSWGDIRNYWKSVYYDGVFVEK
jgi:hypothetical protein